MSAFHEQRDIASVSGSNELDFFSQLFSQAAWLPLSIFLLGGLYLLLMAIIFRRAAERRRKARMALGELPSQQPAPTPDTPVASRLSRFMQAARLPEPDLDLLLGKPNLPAETTAPVPVPSASPVAVAHEESLPVPETILSEPISLPEDAVEVMRIWRDISDGSLIIQIGDQYYRHSAAISNPEQKRRFEAVVRTLSAMIGLPSAPLPKPIAATSAPAASAPAAEPPKRGLFGGKPKPAEPEPLGGIADQIEEFLQARLLASPQFSTRSIHVRPTLDHGVRIEVDGHFYDSVAEVIDPDVREFLINIMREWEARH
ncbi:MAG: hypothetical protein CUN49_14160 [Candidatus Thermofonsia Clade 1 bacterium]|uniref:Uncharacterized protein n=1 Tax=Candidatus Thermofonsia Clade 1 bacterium TaxID=2364210 RepID=A0A2M8PB39_9CHLR|nr:MAG: hypothetical protein CUN49_14160 [Candidatus Thermofonsia Clade 1 bacterium]